MAQVKGGRPVTDDVKTWRKYSYKKNFKSLQRAEIWKN